MPDIRIIVAGANPVMRARLARAIRDGSGLILIAETPDLPEAYTAAETLEPEVILIARELTVLAEFALMRSLFAILNIRWITVDHRGLGVDFRLPGPPAANEIGLLPLDSALPVLEIRALILVAAQTPMPAAARPPRPPLRAVPMRPGKLILIGASTGGVDALLEVLSALPDDCPPVAVVQHTGQGFSDSLIRLLARRCRIEVRPALANLELHAGMAAIAAGCPGHMRLSPGPPPRRIRLDAGPPVSGHMPSVDALFASGVPMARQIVAVLLTGMGRDGAEGLLALRRAGAMTIGQDAPSSVVYGMPRAAWEIGAVQNQVRLEDIAAAMLRACAEESQASP